MKIGDILIESDDILWRNGASGSHCTGQISYRDVLRKAIIVSYSTVKGHTHHPTYPNHRINMFMTLFPHLVEESETYKVAWITSVVRGLRSVMVKSLKTGVTGVFLPAFTGDPSPGALFTMVGPIYNPTDHTEIRVELEIRAT